MKVTNYTVPTALSRSYSFALLADMHSRIPQGILMTLTALVPDFIVLAGDIVDGGFQKEPQMLSFLAGAAMIAPTYYATGNHELFSDTDRELVASVGVTLLEDAASVYDEIHIAGLASGFGHSKAFRKTPPPNLSFLQNFSTCEGYKLLISHHPEHYPRYIKDTAIDLTVSGHAHGGQWRIANRGIFAPGQGLFPKYTSGLHTNHDSRLIISRGIGSHTVIPRIFNAPEIVMVHLDSHQEA